MNLEPASQKPWHILFSFALDGGVNKRYTDEFLVLSDGRVFEGWLRGHSPLQRSLGGILDPRFTSPRMRIVLDNTNGQARDVLDQYDFGNRNVTIEAGYGEDASDYTEIFVGVVHFPGGIDWDDRFAYIEIDVVLTKDDRTLPINKIFPSTYPNAEEKSKFKPIPDIYGDWRTTAGGGEKVPCYQIDSTVGTGGKFKIADHALKQIEAVYKNGTSVSFTADLTNGEFTLNVTYDPDADTITANVQGATSDGTPTGSLLQTLPDICKDILQTRLGVAAANIDSTAFTDWGNNLTADDYGRRWIGNEISSATLITELLVEGFADMTIVSGKYTPVYRIVSLVAGIPTYHDFDLVDDPQGGKLFRVRRDPERVFANQIVGQYRYDPMAEDYAQRYDTEDSASIETYATRRRRRLKMNWLYVQAGAEARTDREKFVFAAEPEMVEVTLKSVAIAKQPTDQFRLIYDKFDLGNNIGVPFQIRHANALRNARSPDIFVQAWNMNLMSPGRWTATGHPTWTNSTAWQRLTAGFWTDANGYADPAPTPDEASKRSIWF